MSPRSRPGRRALRDGAAAFFASVVRRSGDRRLEQTIGSRAGLRLLFALVQVSVDPERPGEAGEELCLELRTGRGVVRPWTLHLGRSRVRASPGRAVDPRLTVTVAVADFVRLAAGELDAGDALLAGRVELEGDAALALRLGDLFGGR